MGCTVLVDKNVLMQRDISQLEPNSLLSENTVLTSFMQIIGKTTDTTSNFIKLSNDKLIQM